MTLLLLPELLREENLPTARGSSSSSSTQNSTAQHSTAQHSTSTGSQVSWLQRTCYHAEEERLQCS